MNKLVGIKMRVGQRVVGSFTQFEKRKSLAPNREEKEERESVCVPVRRRRVEQDTRVKIFSL